MIEFLADRNRLGVVHILASCREHLHRKQVFGGNRREPTKAAHSTIRGEGL